LNDDVHLEFGSTDAKEIERSAFLRFVWSL
jgi:hypothetical protein